MMKGFFRELGQRWRFGYPIGQGYRIKPVNRDLFRVSREDFAVEVNAELVSGPVSRHLYTDIPAHWLPPHQDVAIPAHDKGEILDLVGRHFERIGEKVKLVGSTS